MANPLRGEAVLDAGELGRFTLLLNCNALAELQEAFGLPLGREGDLAFLDRLMTLQGGLYRDLRQVLFFALQAKHAERVKNLSAAGVLMDEAGLDAVRSAVRQAVQFAFPEPKAEGDSPPKAERPGAGPE